jgi:hypothetical protein
MKWFPGSPVRFAERCTTEKQASVYLSCPVFFSLALLRDLRAFMAHLMILLSNPKK